MNGSVFHLIVLKTIYHVDEVILLRHGLLIPGHMAVCVANLNLNTQDGHQTLTPFMSNQVLILEILDVYWGPLTVNKETAHCDLSIYHYF